MKTLTYLNIIAVIMAVFAALLMAPFLVSENDFGRWSVFVLAVISAWLILGTLSPGKPGKTTLVSWIIISGVFFIAGSIFEIDKLQYLTAMTLLSGSVAYFCKLDEKAALLILLCFLTTMPLPAGLEAAVSVWLAEREAALFVAFGQTIGMAIYQVGPQVIMGEQAVTINSNCSGTLLLVPSFIGCLTAALQCRGSLLQRTTIVLAAFPLAFAINVVRLAILVVANFTLSPDTTDSLHDIAGWVAMPIAWGLPIIWIHIYYGLQEASLMRSRNFSVLLIAVSVIAAASQVLATLLTEAPRMKSVSVPFYVAGWVGENEKIPEAEAQILAADEVVRRLYTSLNDNRALLVTTMFHRDQKIAAEHSSEKCFKAMGWQTKIINIDKIKPGVQIVHMIVRNHTVIQAVTEITILSMAVPNENTIGTLRLQVVEAASTPLKQRQKTALDFLDKTPINWNRS